MTPAGGWSEAPTDVLWNVIERLPPADYIRFASVCVSWCAALAEKRRPPAAQVPWLLLPAEADTDPESPFRFFSLSEKREYLMPLPEIHGRLCVGSSEGWLICVDAAAELHMFDPMSRSQIDLPSITTFPEVRGLTRLLDDRIEGYFIQPPEPQALQFYDIEFMRGSYFAKVILEPGSTADSYLAVAIHSIPEKLAVARQSDQSWAVIQTPGGDFMDIIFHGGLLYAVDFLGKVTACDLTDPYNPHTIPVGPETGTPACTRYLVVSAGELLQVERKVRNFPSDEEREGGRYFRGISITTRFTVYKINQWGNQWVRVKSLGDHALFLGHNCSVSLSTCDFPKLSRNCIYFTDDHNSDHPLSPYLKRDLGACHLDKGRVNAYYPPNSNLHWPPPIWFTPCLP